MTSQQEFAGKTCQVILTRSGAASEPGLYEDARQCFEDIMAKVGCRPTGVALMWVKPLSQAVAEGHIQLSTPVPSLPDVNTFMFEATAR